ncbi:metal ABC transporter solute-binding protein, Zn/Mn family [Elioraea rosea]|uniref:metal ABC transporter solute-binding protein, Zn/Mn family n=1 Tax=Elioraea rosea TaxID=2492390 RepID=UPI0011825C28|nr:zinc ABC transporter substrate-binding protein [Elioraea rosea]
MHRIARRAVLAAPLLAAPFVSARTARALDPRPTVASFSILGDFLREIGGNFLTLETIVGPEADAHAFSPAPSDAQKLSRARFVVLNGLGFEGWMPRLIRASGFRGTEIVASRGIATIKAQGGSHGHGHGHAHDDADPHVWQDPRRAQAMVRTIAEGLAVADREAAEAYRMAAARYIATLEALDAWVEAQFATIPRARRRIVTSHDAFGYFGARYGIDFLSPQGISTRGEPSAQAIARLVQQIRRERIAALFIEGGANPRVLEQVAAESGARIGGKLYADALSRTDGPAPSYVEMIRHNTRMMAEALAA